MNYYPCSREHAITMTQVYGVLCSSCGEHNARSDGTHFLYVCAPCTVKFEQYTAEHDKLCYLEAQVQQCNAKLDAVLKLLQDRSTPDDWVTQ